MPTEVWMTPEVAARGVTCGRPVTPGADVGRAVVVTSAGEAASWVGKRDDEVVWVVLGDGELPEGLVPFLRLPDNADATHVDAALSAALQFAAARARADWLGLEVARLQGRQLELARAGMALTAERDLNRLLETVLASAREMVVADAGSLYLIEEQNGDRVLRFELAQNDSVPAGLVARVLPLDGTSLAGHVAATGETVNVEDVRKLAADLPYRFNPTFDFATGYHTRSLLAVPMATRTGEVIGVLQLINRKLGAEARIRSADDADAAVRSFSSEDVAVTRAIAAGAAVAIENTRLARENALLFEGFVRASVTAIEQRDPSTSGHSLRVAHYTVALARALEQDPPPAFRGRSFSPDDVTQLRYASLLHDFGKVGVREAVLTKGKKLHPGRIAQIRERFRVAARAREVGSLRRFLASLQGLGRAPSPQDLAVLEEAVRADRRELDALLARVLEANEPAVTESPAPVALGSLLHATFPAEDGGESPLIQPDEAACLAIPAGSLTEEERRQVEAHVVHSYDFLLMIPWPRRFRRVPEIAFLHHEKLNGRGYPNRLTSDEIPLEPRLMAVCDVYDALVAGDRPYKRAVSPERALQVLEDEASRGFLDADLVRLFIAAQVFSRPMPDSLL
jgi:HD-GYP domain-containing protein (c-di-GMP phosphodiesterase class II)